MSRFTTTSDLEASSYAIADNDIVFNKDTGEFLDVYKRQALERAVEKVN